MSSADSIAAAFDGLKQSCESGRTAHAYLIVGAPRGSALVLAESFLQLLFCEGESKPCGECLQCSKVKRHVHPDILWLEPESKSRRIDIEQIREGLNARIAQTSYEGGWKAGVLIHADRMTEGAANAFLKTLEEPAGKSVLLLLTDAAQYLLPTIVSRCQRIMLGTGDESAEDGDWKGPLLEVLRLGPAKSNAQVMFQAALLKNLLETVRQKVEEEMLAAKPKGDEESEETFNARASARALEARTALLRCVLLWKRDVLFTVLGLDAAYLNFPAERAYIEKQASGMVYAEALREMRAVETMVRRLDRNLPLEAVLEVALRGSADHVSA